MASGLVGIGVYAVIAMFAFSGSVVVVNVFAAAVRRALRARRPVVLARVVSLEDVTARRYA